MDLIPQSGKYRNAAKLYREQVAGSQVAGVHALEFPLMRVSRFPKNLRQISLQHNAISILQNQTFVV